MDILSNSLMVATRTDAADAQAMASSTSHKGWDIWRSIKRVLAFPVRFDRAFKSYEQFKSMDVALMMDVGLTQADVDRANFRDFIQAPRR